MLDLLPPFLMASPFRKSAPVIPEKPSLLHPITQVVDPSSSCPIVLGPDLLATHYPVFPTIGSSASTKLKIPLKTCFPILVDLRHWAPRLAHARCAVNGGWSVWSVTEPCQSSSLEVTCPLSWSVQVLTLTRMSCCKAVLPLPLKSWVESHSS